MSKSRLLWIALTILALAMCCFGLWRGEVQTVLVKGSNICLECIGLG